jgi:hypothetical protein
MVKGISPLRLALMFAAALGAAGCGRSSAAHFKVTGEGRNKWPAAAQQILQGKPSENGCGIPNPTPEQIQSAANLLGPFGVSEVENAGCWGTLRSDPSTPKGVDTENCGIGSSSGSYTSVAVPPGLCPAQGGPSPDAGAPEAVTPPPPKPDAGIADAGVPETVTPPVQPDAGAPEVEAQPPVQDIGPEEVTQPEVAGPSPEFEQAKASLRSAISRAGRVYSQLSDNELTGNNYAKKLRREKNEAQAALSDENASLGVLQSALSQLNSAISGACTQGNNDVRGLGGSISCQ